MLGIIKKILMQFVENIDTDTCNMTEEECIRAVAAGIGVCGELADRGYRILTAGEMGIGNTTPTAVLAASFLGMTAGAVTGRGAGLNEEGFRRKVGAVNRALVRIRAEKRPPEEQTVEIEGIPVNARALAVLSEGGGLELAAMAGLYLGGMKYGLAVVIDGIISSVSARRRFTGCSPPTPPPSRSRCGSRRSFIFRR